MVVRFIIFMVGILVITLSSATAEVLFNEIMYDVNGSDTGHEWIEIANTGSASLNLTFWKLYEQGTNHNLNLITGSSTLPAGEFAVIADDAAVFQQDNPAFSGHLFDSIFSLSNSGEYLALYNGSSFVSNVTYSNSWGGGNSYSLERFNDLWNTSLVQNGTPGKENSIIPCLSNLVILVSDWVNETACLRNDTYIQNRTLFQYDANNCQQNQTWTESQVLSCDYCTPSWTPVNTSCFSDDGIIQWHNDSNRCYEQTWLESDSATMPGNRSYELICDYNMDGFIGNVSDLNTSLTLIWEKNATSLIFRTGNKMIVEFPILEETVNFKDLFMETQSNGSAGYVIVRGWALEDNQTKTIHLDTFNSTSNAVCIKDAEVNSIADLSTPCNGENETMVFCDGELHHSYRCTAGEQFIVRGLHHSAVQEFYSPAVPSNPDIPSPEEPVPSSSGGGSGGGGGGGSSCPPGKTLQQGKCVAVAIIQNNLVPPEKQGLETVEKRMPAGIVEKDIEMSFANAKPISQKPLLTNIPFGSEITGAVAGVPQKSLKVIPLLVISGIVIFSCAAAWMVKGRKW